MYESVILYFLFFVVLGNINLEVLEWLSHKRASRNVMLLCYLNTNVLMFVISWGAVLILKDERYMMQ